MKVELFRLRSKLKWFISQRIYKELHATILNVDLYVYLFFKNKSIFIDFNENVVGLREYSAHSDANIVNLEIGTGGSGFASSKEKNQNIQNHVFIHRWRQSAEKRATQYNPPTHQWTLSTHFQEFPFISFRPDNKKKTATNSALIASFKSFSAHAIFFVRVVSVESRGLREGIVNTYGAHYY